MLRRHQLALIKNRSVKAKAIIVLAILLSSTGIMGAYATFESTTVPIEVKEPLELLAYNPDLSLYPGETLQLSVPVENHASVSYNTRLTFSLNDTGYQEEFVNFSTTVYTVAPSTNNLDAWLYVSPTAPAAQLQLAIGITRDVDASPTPTPTPTPPSIDNFSVSMQLFAAGAKWAAQNGTSALYVNWYDNYVAHHLSDPSWGPYWREGQLGEIKNITVNALEQQGFTVTCVGDVPSDLSSYNLVIFEAWFACEPSQVQQVREYLAGGGNVVVIGGAPCYFATYCKDMWPYVSGGENLATLEDWFGSAQFVNSGGTANLVVDKPFGLPLQSQSQIYRIDAYGCYALASMGNDTQVLARWADGAVYAFTHEYGNGRVYYQAEMDWG
jgi:hypothetical protein